MPYDIYLGGCCLYIFSIFFSNSISLATAAHCLFWFQENVFMHLTNYAINKTSSEFIRDDEAGSKRYAKLYLNLQKKLLKLIFQNNIEQIRIVLLGTAQINNYLLDYFRRISTINKWFQKNNYDLDKLWRDIDDVIIKTLIAANATLRHNYRTCFPNHIKGSACFEILGFDVMIDKRLKPYLLEVIEGHTTEGAIIV